MNPTPADRAPARGRIYRVAIPLAALALFATFALLRVAGLQAIGDGALRLLGVAPGPFPFLDTHAVLAAAECQRRGIDVYLFNPCDVFGRTHVYSPLWLVLVPPGLGTAATPWVGAGLDLLFIAALGWLLRPQTGCRLLILAIAVFSPTTVYALERANNELVIFLLVLVAGLLQARSRVARLLSYGVIVGAALLKYFPAVLLSLAARERRRDALCVAGGAALAAALCAVAWREVLGQALANIPPLSYYTDSFSAANLPFGLATGLPFLADPRPVAVVLFAVMAALAAAWLRRAVTLLDGAGLDWTGAEVRFAAIGGLLLAGCFFAGQNVAYRGIHFLFVLPGLLLLHAAVVRQPAARRFLSRLIAAALFLMWEECFRQALLAAFDAQPDDRIAMVFWVVREWLWWWTIAGLGAVALCYLKRLPLAAGAERFAALIGIGRSSIGIAAPDD